MTLEKKLERNIIKLLAISKTSTSLSEIRKKLYESKQKMSQQIHLKKYDNNFVGEKAYARIESKEESKSRGMEKGIEKFSELHPKYGKILQKIINEKSTSNENYLFFGAMPSYNLTEEDYIGILTEMGFSEKTAKIMYPEVKDMARIFSKEGKEENILIKKEKKGKK